VKLKNIPNLISLARILLVFPIAYYLWIQNYSFALLLFLIGGLSDGLDGFLARRFHWETKLGVILDPMGDKLMMLVSYLLLGWYLLLPWWLVSLVILRDFILVIGTLLYRKFIGEAKLNPLWISKFNTVCQILLVLIVMLSQANILQMTNIFIVSIETLIWLVTVTTLLSGYAYINEWGRRAWKAIQEEKK
jgi:cardiolipin synthase